jgi:hypothetical protein
VPCVFAGSSVKRHGQSPGPAGVHSLSLALSLSLSLFLVLALLGLRRRFLPTPKVSTACFLSDRRVGLVLVFSIMVSLVYLLLFTKSALHLR